RAHWNAISTDRRGAGTGGAGRPRGAPHWVSLGQRYQLQVADRRRKGGNTSAGQACGVRKAGSVARHHGQSASRRSQAQCTQVRSQRVAQEGRVGLRPRLSWASVAARALKCASRLLLFEETMSSQVLAGFHAVIARLRHAPATIKELYFDEGRRDKRMQSLFEQAKSAGLKCHAVPAARLDGLAGGLRHQGVVALAQANVLAVDVDEVLDELEDRKQPALLLLLDGVTDPHNLGACLRTADAAGVHAVIAPRDRAVGLNATVRRVACGAAETVPYIMVTNLARSMRALKERDVWLVGTDDQA